MQFTQLLLKNQLCHRLYKASNLITRAYRSLLEPLELTYPQYLVMLALWEEQNITMSEITERTAIDAGALTLIVKKLGEKGLLMIISESQDKRKKRLQLTSKGIEMAHNAASIPEKIRCQFDHMDTNDLAELARLLDKLEAKGSDHA